MKPIILSLACALLSSCATRVYEGGLPVLATYSNSSYLKFKTGKGTELEMRNVDNSTPTTAAANGATKILMSGVLGGAAMAIPH